MKTDNHGQKQESLDPVRNENVFSKDKSRDESKRIIPILAAVAAVLAIACVLLFISRSNLSQQYEEVSRELKAALQREEELTKQINSPRTVLGDVEISSYLDVHNENGYVRDGTLDRGVAVSLKDLNEGEFYVPALAVFNHGNQAVSANIECQINDTIYNFDELYIDAEKREAVGLILDSLRGATGDFEVIWFYNGYAVQVYNWSVQK